ncbi:hypothetical protein Dip510_000851 [Elusimicrobium posterum]|uniref:hypothetical protein n=1 Tax=Elusimicrobium posterum TaxID=3116653 RepID=UPI003C70F5ED
MQKILSSMLAYIIREIAKEEIKTVLEDVKKTIGTPEAKTDTEKPAEIKLCFPEAGSFGNKMTFKIPKIKSKKAKVTLGVSLQAGLPGQIIRDGIKEDGSINTEVLSTLKHDEEQKRSRQKLTPEEKAEKRRAYQREWLRRKKEKNASPKERLAAYLEKNKKRKTCEDLGL